MSTSQIALLASVQQFLDRQHGLYIDGAPCAAQSENRLTVWDPATGQAIATTADASPADVDRAVMSAWRAFVDRRWAGRTPADRERILLRFADLVEQHGEELAQLETLEQGKSIAISRAFEVGCTLNCRCAPSAPRSLGHPGAHSCPGILVAWGRGRGSPNRAPSRRSAPDRLDVGGAPPPEATGVESVLAGLRASIRDDDQLLTAANAVFDGLLATFQPKHPVKTTTS